MPPFVKLPEPDLISKSDFNLYLFGDGDPKLK
jgi:hypothetical protein